jgi:hypothetical protein
MAQKIAAMILGIAMLNPAHAGGSMAPDVKIIWVNPPPEIRAIDRERARQKARLADEKANIKSAEQAERARQKNNEAWEKERQKRRLASKKPRKKK